MTENTKKQKKLDQSVREKALKLYDEGNTAEEVAKKLKVRKMTVAAWVAHRTMGTYDR